MKIEMDLHEMAVELKDRVLDELYKDGHSLREWFEMIHSLGGFEEVKRLKQERDAAVQDIEYIDKCDVCKRKGDCLDKCQGFEWRGVQEGGAPHV